jgi:SAM-dependent methyltransferase
VALGPPRRAAPLGIPLVIAVLAGFSPDGRPDRAALTRAHDAWLGESGADLLVVEPDDPRAALAGLRLEVAEAEAAVAPGGLARAAAILAASAASSVEPAGFWRGGSRIPEPYATVWEFEEVAAKTPGPPAPLPPGSPAAPVALRRAAGGDGSRLSTEAWTVHSFAFRRGHARPEVAALVPPGSARVLEIGCGEGALGAGLERAGARVTGVEPDAGAARVAASRLSRVVPRGLNEAWDEIGNGWDAVVAADVLEHLDDPLGALRRLRERCRPGAALVVSLPNASHAAVLGGALKGRWDLALEGVVADDHRTWAGGPGWRRLLAACGWRVEAARPVTHMSPRVEPWVRVLEEAGLPEAETTAIQWLFVARAATPEGSLELGGRDAAYAALAEDPVGAARGAAAASGEASWTLPNAVSGAALEALLMGDVALGEARTALSCGFTAAGLARRFRGSGLGAAVTGLGSEALPPRVAAALEAARRAGLRADAEAVSSRRLGLNVRVEAR